MGVQGEEGDPFQRVPLFPLAAGGFSHFLAWGAGGLYRE
jgi:hypothetical protein